MRVTRTIQIALEVEQESDAPAADELAARFTDAIDGDLWSRGAGGWVLPNLDDEEGDAALVLITDIKPGGE